MQAEQLFSKFSYGQRSDFSSRFQSAHNLLETEQNINYVAGLCAKTYSVIFNCYPSCILYIFLRGTRSRSNIPKYIFQMINSHFHEFSFSFRFHAPVLFFGATRVSQSLQVLMMLAFLLFSGSFPLCVACVSWPILFFLPSVR